MRYTIGLAVIALVIVAGCISSGNEETLTAGIQQCTPAGIQGLEITGLAPDVIEQRANDAFIIGLDMQNFGNQRASGIIAELSNLGSLNISQKKQIRVSDIDAPVEGLEQKDTVQWGVTAPDVIGEPQSLNVETTLSYDYVSTGSADIVYIPTEDWRIMRQQGAEESINSNQLCTSGPLSVSVEPANPVVADQGLEKETTVKIALINYGVGTAGNVYSAQLGQYVVDSIELTLPPGIDVTSMEDCSPFTTRSGNVLKADNVRLTTKETTYLICRVAIKTTPSTKNTYKVTARALYRYKTSETTGVTVLPAEHLIRLKPYTPAPSVINFAADTLSIGANVTYDSACLDYEAEFNDSVKTTWSANVRNDNSGLYPLEFRSVTGNCSAGYNVTFGKPTRKPSKLLCTEPAKVTLKAVFKSQSDSRELSGTTSISYTGIC
jgi:hypothetical protein